MKTLKPKTFFRFSFLCFVLITSHLIPSYSFSKESNSGLLNNLQFSIDAGMAEWKQGDDINVASLELGYRLPDFNYGSITFELGFTSSTGGGEITENAMGTPIEAEGSFESVFASTTFRSSGRVYLLGKAGYGRREFTLDFINPVQESASDTSSDMFAGAGIGLRPVKNIEIELDYTSFEEEQSLLSLGFNFKFDSQPSSDRKSWEQEKLKTQKRKEKPAKKLKPVKEPKPKKKAKPAKKAVKEATEERADPMVIKPYQPAPKSKAPASVEESLDKDLPIGRSAYTAERTARMDACRRPTLYTKRNNWPNELYKAVCSDGSSRIISCEWGQCKVVK